ncbi:MAG: hypothetical protein JEY99_19595 [Spirochaetales bacterium]|nr:hypothetical protein [Spirochaetales bacterium]
MKRFFVMFLIVLACSIVNAQDLEGSEAGPVISKSIFSIDVGYVGDGGTGHGYAVFIKSSSFIGEGPVYYGFGSLCGGFITTKETFFETGLFIGYNDFIGTTGLDFDIFLDLIVTGGRIYQETNSYRGEAPAIHTGFSLGFPATSDIDGALTLAPVIRPYNSLTGEWDFSRSYLTASFAIRFKSNMEVKKIAWNYSSKTVESKGAIE